LRIIPALALIIAASTVGECAPPFMFTITDSYSAAIRGAMVLIHWDSAGSTVGLTTNVGIKQDLVLTTDDAGNVEAELPPGFYDIFVSANAFTPVCRKLRVRSNSGRQLTLQMPLDPMVSTELGGVQFRPARQR